VVPGISLVSLTRSVAAKMVSHSGRVFMAVCLAVLCIAAICGVVGRGGGEVTELATSKATTGVGEVLIGNIFSSKKAAALKAFNLDAFQKDLQGTKSTLSGAVNLGLQGVSKAKKQIKKVEASVGKQRAQALTAAQVESAMHRDQAAYDNTEMHLKKMQEEMNGLSLRTLQHHQLEKVLDKKQTETDTDYKHNINWDKSDMANTDKLKARIDALAKVADAQHKKLNADIANMLALEQSDQSRKTGVDSKKEALQRVANKEAAAATARTQKPSAKVAKAAAQAAAASASAAVQKATKAAAMPAAAAASQAAGSTNKVPPSCLQMNVVKGVVNVPKACLKYALVQQVLGEAKARGGVQYHVT
jgi:hypothetical protein